jgi:predicted enzyme related to lactoylglutathione lyase
MPNDLKIKLYSFTIDCKDPHKLAEFYAALLGWDIVYFDKEYACVAPAGMEQGAFPGIAFQRNPAYVPPVWPEEADAQQQMAHLDIAVDDLEASVAHATQCGAALAKAQFSDGWKVMIDPVGHPFCLCLMPQVF